MVLQVLSKVAQNSLGREGFYFQLPLIRSQVKPRLPIVCCGPDVIQEIAEFIAERDGHPAQADRIYLTNGASEGRWPVIGPTVPSGCSRRTSIFYRAHFPPSLSRYFFHVAYIDNLPDFD